MAAKQVTIEPTPTKAGRQVLRASVALYTKHLEALAVDAKDLGKEGESARYQREADDLKVTLLGGTDSPEAGGALDADTITLDTAHHAAIGKGLAFWLKNLRAAKGTVRALGKLELASDFEEEAKRVEAGLLPQFQEQRTLPLDGKGKPTPVDDQGKSLKQLADEALAREHGGVTSIDRKRGGG